MILPAARLWFEGKSRELEDVLKEAESFMLNGYMRCAFPGSGQSFIVLHEGKIKEVLEMGPDNQAAPKNMRDLWGKSKIKNGLLQVFEIPPEVGYFLSRLAERKAVLEEGRTLDEMKPHIFGQREAGEDRVLDIHTPEGKGLLIFQSNAITHCFYTENEGFTLTDFEAFKKLASSISKSESYTVYMSRVGDTRSDETPWLPILLGGAAYSGPLSYMKNRLIDKYGHYYGPGTVLFREGDESNDFFLVVSGRVSVYKEKGGRRKILAELGQDEFFGEMAIFNEAPRTATAETIEDSLLIKIGKDELHTLLYNSYEFRINMVKKLSRRLKDTVEETVRMWEDPRAIYLEKIIFQIINSDQKWQEEGIPPGLLMQEISNSSGMRFSEIDGVFRKLLESGKIEFIRSNVVMKEPSSLP